MSCGISDSTIAMNTRDGIAVSTIPKYRKPNTPTVAAPIKYIFLRPMRSEMWPDSGMVTNAGGNQHGDQDQIARHVQRADGVSEDERGEDIERRLLGHPQQCRQQYLLRMLLEDLDDGGLLDFPGIQQLLEHRRLKDAKANP